MSQVKTWISNFTCRGLFCVQWVQLRWEVIVRFVFIRPSLRPDVLWYTNVRLSVCPFHMSRSNLRTPWPIHFKFQCYWNWWSYGVYTLWWNFEFSFQSYGTLFIKLYVILRQFFVCRTVNWEPHGQFTSNFA